MEGHTITRGELEHRFQFHPDDSDNKREAHEEVHSVLLEAADRLVDLTGAPSREQSTMLTKLEEALFWGEASLARGDGPRA